MKIEAEITAGLGASICGWLRVVSFWIMVAFFLPVLFISRTLGLRFGKKIPRYFHTCLAKIMGVKIRVRGEMVGGRFDEQPTFFVSNHSSYLDIPVLGSVIEGCFVAKSEVGSWPFIGMMSRFQNTIFIERRSVRAKDQVGPLRENLEQGNSVILFPEGTSSDGMRALPFKSSLFNIVEKPLADGTYLRVQPVTMICTEIGEMPIGRAWRPYYAWFGDMTLIKHVWDVFRIADFTVDIIFHPPVTVEEFGGRKGLSEHCQRVIADGVDQCITGRFDKKTPVNE